MTLSKVDQLIKENKETKAEFLDLGNLGLTSIPEGVFQLTHLKRLNLGWRFFENGKWEVSKNKGNYNKIKDIPSKISKLFNLVEISFDWNPITNPAFLEKLSKLQTLNVSDTNIKDWSFLKELQNLSSLNLSYNQIQDISFLKELQNLSSLNLSYNQIQDISFLKELQNLSELDLSSNKIQDYSFLKELQNLSELNLSSNKIQDYSFLKELQNLSSLNLNHNQIQDYSFLKELQNLSSLNLNHNQIQDISFLKELQNLSELNLSSNKIQDISFLKELQNLSSLNLSYNQIQDISFLKELQNLSSLNLSYNQIQDISFLKELQNLSELDLSDNQIQDISFLKELQNLSSLNLSSNKIQDYSFLKELQNLSSLNLSYNQIQDISFLKELQNLSSLNLSYNQIQDISFLKELQNLSELNLSDNQIQDISFLKELQNLSELNLSSNQIQDISFLKELQNLSSLNLSYNQIQDISFLKELQNLSELDLSDNQIQDISFLKELQNLSSLNLSSNKIQDYSFLKELQNLSSLNLSYNQIQDISFLKELQNLSSLNLSYNQIQDISFLKELQNLSELNLSDNQIQDISFLKELQNLSELYLSSNQIQDISFLKELQNLSSLNLSDNQIQDISFLKELQNLSSLNLSYNQIKFFPRFLLESGNLNVLNLNLANNPIIELPLEILNQDNCFIDAKSWFGDLKKGSIKNYEVKLIIIGNGRVGKTCTINRIISKPYSDNEPSTHAIKIDQWHPSIFIKDKNSEEKEINLTINIWDFGGQDIYHATHRWFMQSRALFIILWDWESMQVPFSKPEGQEEDYLFKNYKLTYWLDYVRSFSKESPVIIVQNKIDQDGRRLPPSQTNLESMYEVSRYAQISAKQNKGIAGLKELILETYQEKMVEIGLEMPLSWFKVREQLVSLSNQVIYISYEDYIEICEEYDVLNSSTPSLLRYLHDSGNVFYQKELFNSRIILDQKWAIEAVYKIFDREGSFYELRKGDGSFKFSHLRFPLEEGKFSNQERKLILSFMESCEICFRKNKNKDEKDPIYIAPILLGDAKPGEVRSFWEDKNAVALHFIYDHPILHKAFIQRFIVRTGHLAYENRMWLNGIHFRYQSSDAMVESSETGDGGSIYIKTTGSQRLELLHLIQKEFNEIYHYKDIQLNSLVSIDGKIFVELKKLKEEAELNNSTVKAVDGTDIPIQELREFLRDPKEKEDQEEEKRLKDHIPVVMKEEVKDQRIKVFISYALQDEPEKTKLRDRLVVFERVNTIKIFDQMGLAPGEDRDQMINNSWLEQSDIIIHLLSNNFISDNDCYEKQLSKALQMRENGQVKVIPILLDTINNYDRLEVARLYSLPKNGTPVKKYQNPNDAWDEIASALNKIIETAEQERDINLSQF